jgi:membrane protease YdiL (CAAX protease family)
VVKDKTNGEFPRDLIYFPVLYNVVGLILVFFLFAVSPEHLVEPEILNLVLYSGVVIIHWALFYFILRRLGTNGVRELIKPKRNIRWFPSIIVFVSLNLLFVGYMVLALVYGRIPPWGRVDVLQIVFYIALNSITAGFVEELIWRGYFIERLIATGRTEWKAIIYSSVSFAFIHGVVVWDKLIVTFVWGIIAGCYYIRERNLPVLMATHIIIDMIAFGLSIFRPI